MSQTADDFVDILTERIAKVHELLDVRRDERDTANRLIRELVEERKVLDRMLRATKPRAKRA